MSWQGYGTACRTRLSKAQAREQWIAQTHYDPSKSFLHRRSTLQQPTETTSSPARGARATEKSDPKTPRKTAKATRRKLLQKAKITDWLRPTTPRSPATTTYPSPTPASDSRAPTEAKKSRKRKKTTNSRKCSIPAVIASK